MENKVRTIVADMLMNMNDKLMATDRMTKQFSHEMAVVTMKVNETNMKLDRESKIRDEFMVLRKMINAVENGMATDINKAVENHDEMKDIVNRLGDRITDVGKERAQFIK